MSRPDQPWSDAAREAFVRYRMARHPTSNYAHYGKETPETRVLWAAFEAEAPWVKTVGVFDIDERAMAMEAEAIKAKT